MDHPDFPFWRFSLAFYPHPGVEQACLALQDGWGADVNLLLFCCWAGIEEGRPLEAARIERAMAAVGEWQTQIAAPLRGVRRAMKLRREGVPASAAEDLRRRLMALELDAEYLAQTLIAASVPLKGAAGGDVREAVRANLSSYLARAGIVEDEALGQHLLVLADAANAWAASRGA